MGDKVTTTYPRGKPCLGSESSSARRSGLCACQCKPSTTGEPCGCKQRKKRPTAPCLHLLFLLNCAVSRNHAGKDRCHEHREEDKKQNFGSLDAIDRYAEEAKQRCNERDHHRYESILSHGPAPFPDSCPIVPALSAGLDEKAVLTRGHSEAIAVPLGCSR